MKFREHETRTEMPKMSLPAEKRLLTEGLPENTGIVDFTQNFIKEVPQKGTLAEKNMGRRIAELPTVDAIQHMSGKAFTEKYSAEVPPPSHFADKIGYFITNEYDYPNSLKNIKVRGGIHLAIMGGVDPVLGQIAVAHPDLTVIMDINPSSLEHTTQGRISPIKESDDANQYWGKVGNYFNSTVRKIDPRRCDFPIDQDSMNGGWSSSEHFPAVKEAVVQGKIKWASGDFTKDGIELALQLAKDTETPVRLVYVSNIFDYPENSRAEFTQRLARGIADGTVDSDAQVIDTRDGLKTQVLDVSDYIQSFKTTKEQ